MGFQEVRAAWKPHGKLREPAVCHVIAWMLLSIALDEHAQPAENAHERLQTLRVLGRRQSSAHRTQRLQCRRYEGDGHDGNLVTNVAGLDARPGVHHHSEGLHGSRVERYLRGCSRMATARAAHAKRRVVRMRAAHARSLSSSASHAITAGNSEDARWSRYRATMHACTDSCSP